MRVMEDYGGLWRIMEVVVGCRLAAILCSTLFLTLITLWLRGIMRIIEDYRGL